MTNSVLSAERALWLSLISILAGRVQPLNNFPNPSTGSSMAPRRLEFKLDGEEGLSGAVATPPSVGEVGILVELRHWKNPDFKVGTAVLYFTPVKLIQHRGKGPLVLHHVQNWI